MDTFYDGPETTHVSAADPYCPDLRRLLVDTARELAIPVRDGGTVVVIQGPRFSTRAESKWFQNAGWDMINMTAYPGGLPRPRARALLREHLDGHRPRRRRRRERAASHETVVAVFNENNAKLRELLFAVIPKIPSSRPSISARRRCGARGSSSSGMGSRFFDDVARSLAEPMPRQGDGRALRARRAPPVFA